MPLQFPNGDDIVTLLARQNDAAAQAQLASGQIWGQTLAQLGQLPAEIMAQRQAAQIFDLQKQRQQLETQRLQQEQQQEQAIARANQLADVSTDKFYKQGENGANLIDVDGLDAAMRSDGVPFQVRQQRLDSALKLNKSSQDFQDARMKHVTDVMKQIHTDGEDQSPEGMAGALDYFQKTGLMLPKEVASIKDELTKGVPATTITGRYLQAEKPVTVAPGASLVNPATGKPVFQAPERPVSVAPGSSLMQPDTGQIIATSPESQSQLDAAKRAADTAAEAARHNRVMEGLGAKRLAQGGGAAGPGGTGSLTPEGVDYAATIYRLTNKMPSLGMGGKEEKAAIISAAAAQAKALGQSPAAAFQRQAAIKADSGALNKMTSMQAAAQGYEAKALQQADLVEEFSQKVPRTGIPLLNKALVAGQAKLAGDPNAQQLINSITTFSNEYAKIMEGSTGSAAAVSDSARKAADRLINEGLTKGQMTAVIGLMKREMELTMNGYDAAISSINDRLGATQPAGRAGGPPPPGTPPPGAGGGGYIYARDPQGVLHRAPAGTALPKGWVAQ